MRYNVTVRAACRIVPFGPMSCAAVLYCTVLYSTLLCYTMDVSFSFAINDTYTVLIHRALQWHHHLTISRLTVTAFNHIISLMTRSLSILFISGHHCGFIQGGPLIQAEEIFPWLLWQVPLYLLPLIFIFSVSHLHLLFVFPFCVYGSLFKRRKRLLEFFWRP